MRNIRTDDRGHDEISNKLFSSTHYPSYSLPLLRCDWQQVCQYGTVQCLHQISGIAFLVRMEPPFFRVSTHDHPLIFSPEHIESEREDEWNEIRSSQLGIEGQRIFNQKQKRYLCASQNIRLAHVSLKLPKIILTSFSFNFSSAVVTSVAKLCVSTTSMLLLSRSATNRLCACARERNE